MNKSSDWNPDLYLKFKEERTQPSIDLVNKIKIDYNPQFIADIGCGPGNSSQVLLQKWPMAHLVGVDSSANMIEKAKKDYPDNEWILSDAFEFKYLSKFDIIFSNATIQWIPNHDQLFRKLFVMLSKRGVLAVQIPLFWDMPLGQAIVKIAHEDQLNQRFDNIEKLFTIHDYHYYYDVLSGLFSNLEIWESQYMHIMDSHKSILEMIRSTGLKPYLDSIGDDSERKLFEERVLQSIKDDYPKQKNKKVIFPFKRLFFVVYR